MPRGPLPMSESYDGIACLDHPIFPDWEGGTRYIIFQV